MAAEKVPAPPFGAIPMTTTSAPGLPSSHMPVVTLIAKMIMVRMVERNMRWQAVLYRQGLMPAPSSVPAFDQAERSLLRPLQYEFQLAALLLQALPDAESSWTE